MTAPEPKEESRSQMKRIASLKGEPMPEFDGKKAVKTGSLVRVKKGTRIWLYRPGGIEKEVPLKRSQTVRVWNVFSDGTFSWAGSGGYWRHAKLSDCELVDKPNESK